MSPGAKYWGRILLFMAVLDVLGLYLLARCAK